MMMKIYKLIPVVLLAWGFYGCQSIETANQSKSEDPSEIRIDTSSPAKFLNSIELISRTLKGEKKERFDLAVKIVKEFNSDSYFYLMLDLKENLDSEENWQHYPGIRYHLMDEEQRVEFHEQKSELLIYKAYGNPGLVEKTRELCVKILLHNADIDELYEIERKIRELDMDMALTRKLKIEETLAAREVFKDVKLEIVKIDDESETADIRIVNDSNRSIVEVVAKMPDGEKAFLRGKFYSKPVRPKSREVRDFSITNFSPALSEALSINPELGVSMLRCEVGILLVNTKRHEEILRSELNSIARKIEFSQGKYKRYFGQTYDPEKRDLPQWVD